MFIVLFYFGMIVLFICIFFGDYKGEFIDFFGFVCGDLENYVKFEYCDFFIMKLWIVLI